MMVFMSELVIVGLVELDGLHSQALRQHRLVLPNLVDHRLGCIPLEEELDDLLGLGADDAVEEHRRKDTPPFAPRP